MSQEDTIPGWLPPLLPFDAFHGDWGAYVEALYGIFQKDFCGTRPPFQGRPLQLKKHPVEKGKEATFWHFIQEGSLEADRLPDLRRCERIRWPKPVIEAHAVEARIKIWPEVRTSRNGGRELRWYLALCDFSYLVVLADRGTYLLPWTAYHLAHPHERRKLEKRWEANRASTP